MCGDGEAGRRGGRGARDTAGQWQWQWRPRRWALLRGIYYYFIIFRGSVLLASEEREKVRERGGEVKGYSHTHHPCPFPHTPRLAPPSTKPSPPPAGRPAGIQAAPALHYPPHAPAACTYAAARARVYELGRGSIRRLAEARLLQLLTRAGRPPWLLAPRRSMAEGGPTAPLLGRSSARVPVPNRPGRASIAIGLSRPYK